MCLGAVCFQMEMGWREIAVHIASLREALRLLNRTFLTSVTFLDAWHSNYPGAGPKTSQIGGTEGMLQSEKHNL